MKSNKIKILYTVIITAVLTTIIIIALGYFKQDEPVPITPGEIKDNTFDPAEWGKIYPLEYDSWKKTKEPRPTNLSKYKKGWDTDKVVYDKLSEYPYMALLFNGWGFGIEYNEPRGHWFMIIDQIEIDPSRLKSGGACLTCKSPYISKLVEEHGEKFHSMPFFDALNLIPEEHKELGATCIDCHDNKTLELEIHRWNTKRGLKEIGKINPTRQEMRIITCGQCHCTYFVKKDENRKSIDVVHPWKGSKWGNITIENIIADLKSDKSRIEWKQTVTGFKLGFIRHPEFEFYTNNSPHFNANVSCADCHMPYIRVGANKISDHNLMSPLKANLKACVHCHTETEDVLRKQVYDIQDRTMSLLMRSGYATAVTAKLFEKLHNNVSKEKLAGDNLYQRAREFYEQALYRVIFLGAENSIGFHNPAEAGRIATDATAFAVKSESYLRQLLSSADVDIPESINLELSKYLNNRGEKPLNYRKEQRFFDPTDIREMINPEASLNISE